MCVCACWRREGGIVGAALASCLLGTSWSSHAGNGNPCFFASTCPAATPRKPQHARPLAPRCAAAPCLSCKDTAAAPGYVLRLACCLLQPDLWTVPVGSHSAAHAPTAGLPYRRCTPGGATQHCLPQQHGGAGAAAVLPQQHDRPAAALLNRPSCAGRFRTCALPARPPDVGKRACNRPQCSTPSVAADRPRVVLITCPLSCAAHTHLALHL